MKHIAAFAAGVGTTAERGEALRVGADCTVRRVAVAADESGSCAQMLCEQIGCRCFDAVSLTGDLDMWVDDGGVYNAPVNRLASAIAVSYGFGYRPYFGVALFTSRRGEHTVGLNADQLAMLEDMAAAFVASAPPQTEAERCRRRPHRRW